MRLAPLFIVLLLFAPALAAQQVEVIELRHRTVEDVLPVLEPLVEPGGALSGMNGHLIVRTSPGNLQELRKVLSVIDRPARQLVIRVSQNRETSGAGRSLGVSGTVEVGENVRVVAPGGNTPGGTGVEVRGGGSAAGVYGQDIQRSASSGADQFVRVMDGSEAFIRIGRSLAVPFRRALMRPGGVRASQGVVYIDIGQGFSALPRVSGDRVTIEISPQFDSLAGRGRDMETQSLSTTVSGRLGEWIELGGGTSRTDESTGSLTGAAAQHMRDTRSVWLLVEEVR
jgi:type II secretory pathway component GspD/PulD (secretin)